MATSFAPDPSGAWIRPAHRMQLIFQGGHHAEVGPRAANGPEQIGVFVPACPEGPAIGGDKVNRQEIVDCQAVLAYQPAQPSAQGEPGDTRGGHDPAGGGQAVQLRLTVELAPGDASLGPGGAGLRVNVNAPHGR
jgi:hypothetical protein